MMSAQLQAPPQPRLARRAMTLYDVDAVQAIEAGAYPYPWTRGNFIDSLAAGYLAEVLEADGAIVAYFVAMAGVDELHLLNITVAVSQQGQGHGRRMLDVVQAHGRQAGLATLLLEVRLSNERARALYRRRGFAEIGLRPAYYPALQGREDALVMSLALAAAQVDPHGVV